MAEIVSGATVEGLGSLSENGRAPVPTVIAQAVTNFIPADRVSVVLVFVLLYAVYWFTRLLFVYFNR